MILILYFALTVPAFAHEAGETEAQIGQGKAVEAYDQHKGIKLSEKAVESLGIKLEKLSSKNPPKTSMVFVQSKTFVFIASDGWFKMIELDDLKAGDSVVVHGAPLLRVAYINVSESGEKDEHEEHKEHGDSEGEDHD